MRNIDRLRLGALCLLGLLLTSPAWADRIYTQGMEFNSTGTDGNWSIGCNGSPTIDTTADRSGTYGLHISSLSSGTVKGCRFDFLTASSATAHVYLRAYVRFVTLPSATQSTVFAVTTAAFTTRVVGVRVDNTGAIEVYDEDGQVGTDCNSTVTTGTWYRFELHVDGSPAAGSDVVEFRLDGSDQTNCSSSARTLDTAFRDIFVGGNGNGEAQTTGEWYIDDVGVNNTSGTTQTSWLGAGSVGIALVDADGDTTNRGTQGTEWDTCTSNSDPCTTGTGGTAYQMVDDANTPDDGTTAVYLLQTSTGAADSPILMFGVQSLTSTGTSEGVAIDSDDTITFLAVQRRGGSPGSAATHNWTVIITSGGTAAEDSNSVTAGGGSFAWDRTSTTIDYSQLVRYTDPNTSSAWTLSAADAVEIGIRSSDVTPLLSVSMMALQYEYVPVAGGGGTDNPPNIFIFSPPRSR